MPSSYLMRDVIVCIPGITACLRKDGKDIWNVSGGAILNALRTLGGSVKELKLEEDPVDADDVDGITATSVIRMSTSSRACGRSTGTRSSSATSRSAST